MSAFKAGVELGFADIHGVDFGCAVLQEAVGEAAGGCADVHAYFAGGAEGGEAGEGFFQLPAAAADEALRLADVDDAVARELVAGFGGWRAFDGDFTGEDEALGFFAAFGQAAGDEQEVQTGALHVPRFLRD